MGSWGSASCGGTDELFEAMRARMLSMERGCRRCSCGCPEALALSVVLLPRSPDERISSSTCDHGSVVRRVRPVIIAPQTSR